MIKIHGLASWLGCDDRVSSKSHVDTFSGAAIASLGAEHNHVQQGGSLTGLAIVGINIAIIKTHGTSGNFIGVRVILAAWFTDVVETIVFTVFALNSLTIIISSTDSSKSLIAVSISLTFVWDFLASIGVRVTEVSGITV